jgi:transposase
MVDVRISLGSVSAIEHRMSEAIKPVVDEAWDKIPDAPVKHTDGTSWLQQGILMSLWVIATAEVTVYKVLKSGTTKAIRGLFTNLKGILVSDRDSSLGFWAMENRQICWAHLLRKFVSFSERDGPTGKMGQELLDYALLTFEYWHAYQSGEFSCAEFQAKMKSVSEQFSELLQRAVNAKIYRFSGSCANIIKHEEALWTFVSMDGVEPTNNHAERELREFVLWRKRSFGSQSTRGNEYAQRMMTVIKTARKQGRDILSLLIAAIEARHWACPTKIPSLFVEA